MRRALAVTVLIALSRGAGHAQDPAAFYAARPSISTSATVRAAAMTSMPACWPSISASTFPAIRP